MSQIPKAEPAATVGLGRASRLALAALLVLVTAGCSATALHVPTGSNGSSTPSVGAPAATKRAPTTEQPDAQQVLEQLPVKGRAPKTGYSREQFGPAWADVDNDGCDSRNQLLQAQLTQVRLKPGSRCVVLTGDLADPYTGRTIHFVRAGSYEHAVDLDHAVIWTAWACRSFAMRPTP